MALCGCVRDKIMPCPPLSIEVTVQDKNWDNIDEVESQGLAVARDENLPFREYVSTLAYELKDCATGETVSTSAVYTVSHDGKSEILTFPEDLPFGRYELTLWGNLDPDSSDGETVQSVTLHEDGGGEADEVYHYNAVIDYDYDTFSYTAGLLRTVGCLIVDVINLPDGMDYSRKDMKGIMGTVSKGLDYSDPVSLVTELDWEKDDNKIRTATCLGPSPEGEDTEVRATFRDNDTYTVAGNPYEISASPVDVVMERNMLTVLRYDYRKDGFHISVLINNRWETLHGMIVD